MIEIEKELKGFYEYFLRSLAAIADENNPGKCWHIELFEDFFSPFEYVVEWKSLSQQQRNDLQKLGNMLNDYNLLHHSGKEKTDKEIWNDPEWHKIRDYAKLVFEELTKHYE